MSRFCSPFVTRMKVNAIYKVVEHRVIPQNRPHMCKNPIIRLSGVNRGYHF